MQPVGVQNPALFYQDSSVIPLGSSDVRDVFSFGRLAVPAIDQRRHLPL